MRGTLTSRGLESIVPFVEGVLNRDADCVLTLTIQQTSPGVFYVGYVTENLDGITEPIGCEKQQTISTTRLLELDNYDGA